MKRREIEDMLGSLTGYNEDQSAATCYNEEPVKLERYIEPDELRDLIDYALRKYDESKEISALKEENEQLKKELEEASKYKDEFFELNSWLVTQVKIHEKLAPKGSLSPVMPKVEIPEVGSWRKRIAKNMDVAIAKSLENTREVDAAFDDVPAGGLTDKD